MGTETHTPTRPVKNGVMMPLNRRIRWMTLCCFLYFFILPAFGTCSGLALAQTQPQVDLTGKNILIQGMRERYGHRKLDMIITMYPESFGYGHLFRIGDCFCPCTCGIIRQRPPKRWMLSSKNTIWSSSLIA
jgi:hypothetical protein